MQRAGLARGLEAQHRGLNERPNDLHWSAATRGGVGRLAPAAWHTTARTANPARAGGSPGAALACPQPALTGPATAALAGRAGTSPRLSPAGGVPVTPLGATRLRPYGSSGRATARSVAGRLPRFRRQPRAAQEPPRGAGRGAKPPWTARSASDPQSPEGGRGERSGAGHATPAVPRTGATAAEVPRVPGVPGQAWPEAPARWQAAMQALEERPAPACPRAGA